MKKKAKLINSQIKTKQNISTSLENFASLHLTRKKKERKNRNAGNLKNKDQQAYISKQS